jgi:hypothetical protein
MNNEKLTLKDLHNMFSNPRSDGPGRKSYNLDFPNETSRKCYTRNERGELLKSRYGKFYPCQGTIKRV